MRCDDAVRILSRWRNGPSPEPFATGDGALLETLSAGGWVVRVDCVPGGADELVGLRAKLEEVARRRAELLRSVAEAEKGAWDRAREPGREVDSAVGAIDELDRQARTLRTRVLEIGDRDAQAAGSLEADESRWAVTYRGRALLADLVPRLNRVAGADVATFESEMASLRASMSARAKRAADLLGRLAPRLRQVEEIHVRSAAVGLAVLGDPPSTVETVFPEIVGALLSRRHAAAEAPSVAECLCVDERSLAGASAAAMVEDLAALRSSLFPLAKTESDLLGAALVVHPLDAVARAAVTREIADLAATTADGPGVLLGQAAPIALVAVAGLARAPATPARLATLFDAVRTRLPTDPNVPMATAILALSPSTDTESLVWRFGAAQAWLARFGEDPLPVPAAMLAILAEDVEETLDDLRIACAEVHRHRLSLGGMETLSLGVKLLLQHALGGVRSPAPAEIEGGYRAAPATVSPAPGAAPALGLVGLSVALPVAFSALSAFHQVTLHQVAVSDFAFHPVHSHYVPGYRGFGWG